MMFCFSFGLISLNSYANIHSGNNAFAVKITGLRERARSIIKRCVHATDEDVVIFVGSGSTAAINKLVNVLNLRDEDVRHRTVVFISSMEHHSNILPWQNTGVEVNFNFEAFSTLELLFV